MSMNSSTKSSVKEKVAYFLEYRGKLIALLLSLMFILWLVTISTTHIIKFPPDPFYYVKELPVTYWVGMLLAVLVLTLLVYRPLPRMKTLAELSFIAILILYLVGTPCFIYSNPRYSDVYGVANLANWISTTGGLTGMGSWYLTDYPVATISFSVTSQILGVDALSVAQYYPIPNMFLLALLLYVVARKITLRYCLIAPIAYISLGWAHEYHMCPLHYALLLSILLLFLMLSLRDPTSPGNEIIKRALIIVIGGLIMLSHGGTPLLNVFALFSLWFIYNLITRFPLTKGKHPWGERSPRVQAIMGFILFFAVAYLSYAFYKAEFVWVRLVVWIKITLEHLLSGETFVFVQRHVTTPTASYALLNSIRWASIIGTLVSGVLSSLYLFLKGKSGSFGLIMVSFFIGYMGVSFYLVVAGFAFYGADRGFIFGLIPASVLYAMVVDSTLSSGHAPVRYLQAHLLKGRRWFDKLYPSILTWVILLFIIVSMLALPVTKYGSDPYAFMSESQLAGRLFRQEHPEAKGMQLFSTSGYNHYELLRQEGEEYKSGFLSSDLNMIYDSGQCQIFLQVSQTQP